MKKILTLVSLLFVTFVAGAQTPATRLESLPIGSYEAISNQVAKMTVRIHVGFRDTTNTPPGIQPMATGTDKPYNVSTDGDLPTLLRNFARENAENYVNSDFLFPDKYRIFERKFMMFFTANSDDGAGGVLFENSPEFSFVLEDGKLKLPKEAWDVPIRMDRYYEPISVSGVRWVEIIFINSNGVEGPDRMEGVGFEHISRNGSYNCPELEKLWGNGVIYLPSILVDGKMRNSKYFIRGFVTLYYDDEKTDYDRFDLLTGSLLERVMKNPPQFSSPKITISPLGEGVVEIGVEGLGDNSAIIEYQQEDGEWKPLSSPLRGASAGKVSLRDTANAGMRFYRARVVSVTPSGN